MSGSESPTSLRFPEAVSAIYDVLERCDAGTRSKVIAAILMAFEEDVQRPARLRVATPSEPSSDGSLLVPQPAAVLVGPTQFSQLGKRVQAWLRRFSISDEALEKVFDSASDWDVIASVRGGTKREASFHCYLLAGVSAFLRSDEPRFTDADAVELCKREFVYDRANHAHTRTTFGNKITGSKESGYSLTGPGLEVAANLVKSLPHME